MSQVDVPSIAWTRSAKGNLTSSFSEAGTPLLDKPADTAFSVFIIERRTFFRECLTRSLRSVPGCNPVSFASVDSWLTEGGRADGRSLIVLCAGGRGKDQEIQRQIGLLSQKTGDAPTILLSDVEEPDYIVDILRNGARGYIPTSVPFDVVIEAMRFVLAGGVFVPASSLIAAQRSNGIFTARQSAVVEAVRHGKANKTIAHELNMHESTVKVHVRNIMKKLKAKNRTEVAIMANALRHED